MTSAQNKKDFILKIFLIIAIIEGIFSIWVTLSIPADSKNSFFLGLSFSRLVIVLISIIGIGFLIYLLGRTKFFAEWHSYQFTSDKSNRIITGLCILSILLLWVTLATPTKNFLDFEAFFIRLRPSLVWIELILLKYSLFQKVANNSFSIVDKQNYLEKSNTKIFFLLVGSWIFISTTKVGLVQKTAFWNVPGIPLSMIQFIGIVFLIFVGLLIYKDHDVRSNKDLPQKLIIPILIFIVTITVWGFTPMLKHFFSLEPTHPNLQPFPYSDARVHDLGAISILKGEGIYFRGFTDKPMYMVFLAVLHLISGNNYVALAWTQIFVLAFIPVIFYEFGKKYQSPLFGIVLSAIILLQQRNAIKLSHIIASVNPKLLVTEELMLLGITFFTYLLFIWMRKPQGKTILLLGGILGVLSLIRINPIFIVPVIVLVIYFYFRNMSKMFFKQVVLFFVGFLLVFSPWLFVGVTVEGESWFFIKIQDVIINRYPISQESLEIKDSSNSSRIIKSNQGIQNISFMRNIPNAQDNHSNITHSEFVTDTSINNSKINLIYIMFNHFLHNFSTSLLALPNSVTIENLSDLAQREYWQEENNWNGNFSIQQYLLILVNLFILSIGLTKSWKKYRWAGLAPLMIFLAYDVSLSFALNSGSRYIVPIGWVLFFYYVLGIIQISKIILNVFNIKTNEMLLDVSDTKESALSYSERSTIPVFTLLVLIAVMVPVANLVVPALKKVNQENIVSINSISNSDQEDKELYYGIILYPYYESDEETITFDFLSNQVVNNYQIERKFLVDNELIFQSDLPAYLEFSKMEDKQQLESIFLINEKKPYLVWQKHIK